MRSLFSLLIILIISLTQFIALPLNGNADETNGASLSIFPQGGSFTVGSNLDVTVFVNTGGENVNAVRVNLKFDPRKLQVITPAKGLSLVSNWTFPPGFSNTNGTITLQGGFPQKGINTSEGLITVIEFEAISTGKTELYFLDDSVVLKADEKGTNILTSVNKAVFDVLSAPLKGPKIFSETHPDQNRWYKNDSPAFSWEKIEGAIGYSYSFDEDPYGEPDNTIDTQSTFASFENVGDGVKYFHLKAKKEQVWGGTSHFMVMIDKTPPLQFKPYLESFNLAASNYLLIYFKTTDLLSGIDYYESKLANITNPENVIFSGWMRQESPYRLSIQEKGLFEIIIRASDQAGNFQEGKIRIKLFNPFLILTSGGIEIKGFFIRWWQIHSLSVIILAIVGFLLFRLIRKKHEIQRISLEKEIKEAEKEIEDVKKAEEEIRRLRAMEERAGQEWKRLKGNLDQETKE